MDGKIAKIDAILPYLKASFHWTLDRDGSFTSHTYSIPFLGFEGTLDENRLRLATDSSILPTDICPDFYFLYYQDGYNEMSFNDTRPLYFTLNCTVDNLLYTVYRQKDSVLMVEYYEDGVVVRSEPQQLEEEREAGQ